MAFYDFNTYIQPYSGNIIQYKWGTNKWQTLAQWRTSYPLNDVNSKAFTSSSFTKNDAVVLFTNKTNVVRTINLSACSYQTPDGNAVTTIDIQPFTSKILINKNATTCNSLDADMPVAASTYSWNTKNYDSAIASDTAWIVPLPAPNGITNNFSESLKVWPNPVKQGQVLHILNAHANMENTIIDLLDLSGRLVFAQKLKNASACQIRIPTLTPGLYIIRIRSKNNELNEKLKIEK